LVVVTVGGRVAGGDGQKPVAPRSSSSNSFYTWFLVEKELPAHYDNGYQCSLEGESKNDAACASQFVLVIQLLRIVSANISDIEGNYGLISAHYAQLRPHRLPR
jgi:hypothetical protein